MKDLFLVEDVFTFLHLVADAQKNDREQVFYSLAAYFSNQKHMVFDQEQFKRLTDDVNSFPVRMHLLDATYFGNEVKKFVDKNKDISTFSIFWELAEEKGYKSIAEVSRKTYIPDDAIRRMLDGGSWEQRRWYQFVIGMELSLSDAQRLMLSAGRSISLSEPMGLLTAVTLLKRWRWFRDLDTTLKELYDYLRTPESRRIYFDVKPWLF